MRNRLVLAGTLALPLVAAREGIRLDLGSILLFILIGAAVGIIARLIVPGTGGMGVILTVVLGIIGALIGGWVAGAIFEETEGVDWIASIVVAALLVWIASRAGAGGFGRGYRRRRFTSL